MKTNSCIYILALAVGAFLLQACNRGLDIVSVPNNKFRITIEHKSGNNPLVLGQPTTTPLGEPITINVFKYYLSNFAIFFENGDAVEVPNYYFLVDESKPESKVLSLNLPNGKVKELRFLIGVDSIRNVSGVQEGALDPANAMFWTWNSGYIFAKMEGRSSVSTAPLQAVTYHIGGFRAGQNALRQVIIPFSPVTFNSTAQYELVLTADAAKWFSGAHDIKIATEATTMEPGTLALKIADNYGRMFLFKEMKTY